MLHFERVGLLTCLQEVLLHLEALTLQQVKGFNRLLKKLALKDAVPAAAV